MSMKCNMLVDCPLKKEETVTAGCHPKIIILKPSTCNNLKLSVDEFSVPSSRPVISGFARPPKSPIDWFKVVVVILISTDLIFNIYSCFWR